MIGANCKTLYYPLGCECLDELLQNFVLGVTDIETKGQEVVGKTGRGVDLDTTQSSNLAFANGARSGAQDFLHKFILGVVKGVGEFDHLVFSLGETLSVGQEHLSDVGLLGIGDLLGNTGGRSSVQDGLDVHGGGDGGTAASTAVGLSTALDGTNGSVQGDTDVGAVDDEAGTTIGDVGSHGTEGGDTSKGESGKSTHAEVGHGVLGNELLFERAGEFVTAQGRGNKGVGGVVPMSREGLGSHGDQLGVGDGLGEGRGDLGNGGSGLWTTRSRIREPKRYSIEEQSIGKGMTAKARGANASARP